MKNFIKLTATAILSLSTIFALSSCHKEKQPEQKEQASIEGSYNGNVEVVYAGETYNNEGKTIVIKQNKEASTLDITFSKIKFVPQMPITIDILIPGVKYTTDAEGNIIFSGNGIVPMSGPAANEKYTVNELSGKIMGENCEMSLKFGTIPTKFSGKLVK